MKENGHDSGPLSDSSYGCLCSDGTAVGVFVPVAGVCRVTCIARSMRWKTLSCFGVLLVTVTVPSEFVTTFTGVEAVAGADLAE